MNKAAIKNFAVEARRKLISSVKDKAGRIGVTEDKISMAISEGEGYAIFPTHFGTEVTLTGKELRQRENLVNRITEKGYESVMEEVAYTWFNRIIAIRFMEVNDYLPSRVRVLSSETKGKIEPDLVTLAPNVEIELTQKEIEEIISLKEKNELDKLFRLLFIKQCNKLGEILPELFENTSRDNRDFTEILLDISYTNEDGVIRDLMQIAEEDFREAVEIIGWLYQFYNTELKDETFALLKKNVKITKERIPAATQLFTPDWIVRYMVENSLGRLWLEGHPNDTLKANWKYYLDEAEQEPDVVAQLEKIREEYKTIKPEEIKVIDPCMGSGHILVYAFDVLIKIYESCGYTQRDAARLIIENNLHGLDIDVRAYQLAYFAIMMKARQYNRRILDGKTTCCLYSIRESNEIDKKYLQFFGSTFCDEEQWKQVYEQLCYIIELYYDAKELGSILNCTKDVEYHKLKEFVDNMDAGRQIFLGILDLEEIQDRLCKIVEIYAIMSQKYDVVVTNPPYMGSKGMSNCLANYVQENYKEVKADLFSVFHIKCLNMSKKNRYISLLTMESWMFLSSFEEMRLKLLHNVTIMSLVHMPYLGKGGTSLGIAFGTSAFVYLNHNNKNYKANYSCIRYYETDENGKPYDFPTVNERFKLASISNFMNINSLPIAYWADENVFRAFNSFPNLGTCVDARSGISTGGNDKFYRYWFECLICDISFIYEKTPFNSNYKWFPVIRGGEFKKWYGNMDNIINLFNGCNAIKTSGKNFRLRTPEFYNKIGITWNRISSRNVSFRIKTEVVNFGENSPCLFVEEDKFFYVMGFLNSVVTKHFLEFINSTMTFQVIDIQSIPFCNRSLAIIDNLVKNNISISKNDWDNYEISWDFKKHPFLVFKNTKTIGEKMNCTSSIETCFGKWKKFSIEQIKQLKSNEEELNRIFMEIYGLQDKLGSEVDENDITIRKADLQRDIRSLISYAVGCMFGRYSLDVDGLACAGSEWDNTKYTTFIPDKDNVLPITDEEYFNDDIVSRFVEFVKVVYGEDTLEENLDFIANALGTKGGTSREVIRNYFLKDFYKDHVKTYQKRPIYWLFDSGKENGFKALIYLHRYNEDTVGRVRTDYLHKVQAAIENAITYCDMIQESDASASDKAKTVKRKEKLVKQLAETRLYDQAIAHIALKRIPLDLDDGVVVNYAKFQGIEVASEGKKSVKVDLLAKI